LNKSLATYGFTKDDITDVFLTHLHFDHCGGCIIKEGDKLVPAFKNATYWSNESHWKWATEPNEREKASFLKENILPIQQSGQLKFVGINGDATHHVGLKLHPSTIIANLSFIIANGHTDAMMLPVINFNGKTIVYMADLLPSISHIPLPYIMGYDMFPYTTLQEKKQFLTNALTNDYILFFEHDSVNECCNLQMTEKGVRKKEVFLLSEV